jgi:hypothetical protein
MTTLIDSSCLTLSFSYTSPFLAIVNTIKNKVPYVKIWRISIYVIYSVVVVIIIKTTTSITITIIRYGVVY